MRVPLLTTFIPQIILSVVLGVVSIVLFSSMHNDAITESMRNSLRGSMLYVESAVMAPFAQALRDTAQVKENMQITNSSIWRGENEDLLITHPTANNLMQLKDHIQDMQVKRTQGGGLYAYVFQMYRVPLPTTPSGSSSPGDYVLKWLTVAENYVTYGTDWNTQWLFTADTFYPNYNTSDVYSYAEQTVPTPEKWLVPGNSSGGRIGFPYTYYEPFKKEIQVLLAIFTPITYSSVPPHFLTSYAGVELDCAKFLPGFLSDLNVPGTKVTIVMPDTRQVLATNLPKLAPGYEVSPTDNTSAVLWNAYSSRDDTLSEAMKYVDGLGYGTLEQLPHQTFIMEPDGNDHVFSVRPAKYQNTRLSLIIVAITERSYYYEDGDRTSRQAIIITAVLILVSIVVAAITGVLLTHPLADLGKRMELTASLQEDRNEISPSKVKEIAMMQDAYAAMKSELTRMKPFLPQSLIAREDRMDNVLAIPSGHTSATDMPTTFDSKSLDSSGFGKDGGANFVVGSAVLREETNVVTPRDCVVAIVSVGYTVDLDEGGSIHVLDTVFRVVFSAADAYRGVIESVTPHQIVITFGARSTLSDPAGEALNMALRIAHGSRKADGYNLITLLDSGSAYVGCCGTERFRQNIVFSDDIQTLKTLAVSSHVIHRQPILATGRITPSFGKRVVIVPADWVKWNRGEKVSLHAVTQRTKSLGADEEAPGGKELRCAFAAIARAEFKAAVQHLSDADAAIAKHAQHSPYAGRIAQMSANACTSLTKLVEICKATETVCREYSSWGGGSEGEFVFNPGMLSDENPMRAHQQLKTLGEMQQRDTIVFDSNTQEHPQDMALFPMAFEGDPYATGGGSNRENVTMSDGKHVRNWQLSSLPIGTGSFGKVYRALHSNGSLAAVKVLPLRSRTMSIESLHSELSITAQQRHENLVGYVDAEVAGEELMVVMELMAGGSLEGLLRDFGALPVRMVRRFTLGVLRGLGHLHRAGIVHCDVKPQNVLLGVDGVCKLADFGSALHPRQSSIPRDSVSEMMTAIGTPAYMAPEVALGDEPTAASDIWSLGMMVHELLTGSLPLNNAQHAVMRTGANHVVRMVGRFTAGADLDSVEAPPVPRLPDAVPQEEAEMVNSFLSSCLALEPSKRLTVDALMVMEFLL